MMQELAQPMRNESNVSITFGFICTQTATSSCISTAVFILLFKPPTEAVTVSTCPPVYFQGSATVYPAAGLLKVTYCLCVRGVTPGDVGAVGFPLIRVCREAPGVLCSVGVTAVVLPEASETNAATI